jgi:perosamine synthetase
MLVTNDEAYAKRASIMRLHGISGDAWKRYTSEGSWYYEIMDAGLKANMPDLLAAVGVAQLKQANAFAERRRKIRDYYVSRLCGMDELEMPPAGDADKTHAWHLFILRIRPSMLEINRGEMIRLLKDYGIGTSVHFIPLHLHPYYQRSFGYAKGDFPRAENAYSRCISLPIYPDLSEADLERVMTAVESIVIKYRRPVLAGVI